MLSNESGNVSVGCTKWKLEGSNDGSLVWDMLLDNRYGYLINNNQRAQWSAAPADSAEASNYSSTSDLTFYHIPRQSEMLVSGNIEVDGNMDVNGITVNNITVNGTLGIGTTQPQAKLDVAGNLALTTDTSTIKLQGPTTGIATYTLPGDSGANGKYLKYKTGGSGTLEWAQLDSDKIYTDNATISITSRINMSTSGTERLTILQW